MTPLSFRAADGLSLDVAFQDGTVESLLGVLRIGSPLLAAKLQTAVDDPASNVVSLEEDEVELLSAAANTLRKSHRIEDSELDRISVLL